MRGPNPEHNGVVGTRLFHCVVFAYCAWTIERSNFVLGRVWIRICLELGTLATFSYNSVNVKERRTGEFLYIILAFLWMGEGGV